MGWAMFSRHIGLMCIRQCLVKAPPPWHQERTLRNVGLHRQILVKFACIWKAAQSERPRGWFYITIATFYIIIYNRCCIRIYYLMTWANWLLILRYRFTRARRWDKRRVQHPRLFHSIRIFINRWVWGGCRHKLILEVVPDTKQGKVLWKNQKA